MKETARMGILKEGKTPSEAKWQYGSQNLTSMGLDGRNVFEMIPEGKNRTISWKEQVSSQSVLVNAAIVLQTTGA